MRAGVNLPGVGLLTPAAAKRILARAAMSVASLVGLPLRQLGGFVRRDPELVVFGGTGGRFTDNARYLFLALSDDEVLRCVWIARTRELRDDLRAMGHAAEYKWSWSGIRTCLRAGWYVYGSYLGDINYWTSKGARSLNLWHGIGIKAVEFAITTGPLLRVYQSPPWSPIRLAFVDRFHRPDYFLSASPFATERCFAPAFRLTPEQCLEFGYPRTDQFFVPGVSEEARAALGVPDHISEVVGYFPTWRDQGNDFIADSGLSFDRLNDVLAEAGRLLVFKAHPNFEFVTPEDRAWSNIQVLDASIDLNQVLPACDAIITDYSSVAYDFVLLARPVIFFVPDYDRYVSNRNANFSYDDMATGPLVRECDELYRMLGAPTLPPGDTERSRSIRELLWNGYRGGASVQIREFLLEHP